MTDDLLATVRQALAKIPGHAEVKAYPESGYHEVIMDADYYRLWQYAPEWLAALCDEVERLRGALDETNALMGESNDTLVHQNRARRTRVDAADRLHTAAVAFLTAWRRGEDETHALDEADDLDAALDAWEVNHV